MEGLRRSFGIAEPVRRAMELETVRGAEWRAGVLGGSAGVAGDILEGRDWSCDWDDIFLGKIAPRHRTGSIPAYRLTSYQAKRQARRPMFILRWKHD